MNLLFDSDKSFPEAETIPIIIGDTTYYGLRSLLRIHGGMIADQMDLSDHVYLIYSETGGLIKMLRMLHQHLQPPEYLEFQLDLYQACRYLGLLNWNLAFKKSFENQFMNLWNRPEKSKIISFWEHYQMRHNYPELDFDPQFCPFFQFEKEENGKLYYYQGDYRYQRVRSTYLSNYTLMYRYLTKEDANLIIYCTMNHGNAYVLDVPSKDQGEESVST